MPCSLLDLTDELIQDVAFHLHRDNFIPLPSFHPHWSNFASEIDHEVSKDYMNFRSTCRKMRNLCPAKNLHLIIRRWDRLLDWTLKAPPAILKAVRRVEMGISPYKNLSIITAWPTLVHFFSLLPNLEELIIVQAPVCHHQPGSVTQTSDLTPSPLNFLPRLLALALRTECEICQTDLYNLLIPSMPVIKYLKITSQLYYSPETHSLWSERNGNRPVSITHLYDKTLNLFASPVADSQIQMFPDQVPFLETLIIHCSTYPHKTDPMHHMRARQCPNNGDHWNSDYRVSEQFDAPFALFEDIISLDESQFREWMTYFNRFEKLKVLDWSCCFTIEKLRPRNFGFNRDCKAWSKDITSDRVEDYEVELRSAMRHAATRIFKAIPTLQVGYFWEPDGFAEYDAASDIAEWYRWEWKRIVEGDGSWDVEISRIPQHFDAEFTLNEEGTVEWPQIRRTIPNLPSN
ncbi:uncharacterized protein L201_006688 [Kwoniella dendrophila CBS 6074]|uniref:F-box domain-containing protein n=1 Tax=Kwoniella dendrophila CBS 6074 TaxID=1295534 RepID=A0AAX4K1X8_9TREE